MAGSVFVTVGTTKFDDLIRAIDQVAVAEELAYQGFTQLLVQVLLPAVKSVTVICNDLIDGLVHEAVTHCLASKTGLKLVFVSCLSTYRLI